MDRPPFCGQSPFATGDQRTMFGLFRRKPKLIRESDHVYGSRELADRALVRSTISDLELGAPVIVASFFRGSLQRLFESLQPVAPTPRWLEPRSLPALPLTVDVRPLFLLGVSALNVDFNLSSWLIRAELPFRVHFVEHYPTFDAERRVLELLDECSEKQALTARFYVGLDEPLMRAFGGEKIAALMTSLGMTGEERIEHPLVDRSIVRAQKKLGSRVRAPQPAETDAAWFARNRPGSD